VVEEFGGAETGPRAAYVEGVGRRIAAYSGTANAGQVYHFTTLNSAVENAFAVPGGYVYLTRQLMGIMNDESELAFVVGHETGHIAANHAQARKSAANTNAILGVLGQILGSVVGGPAIGGLISQSAQQFSKMRLLSFTRDQEYQADVLGIRYMTAAGYDPNGSATMLSQIAQATALEARFPYGRYAQQAILELAYANYRAGETAAAVAACDRFIRTFPNNQNVDYAYYLKGLVNFREDQGLLGYVYELDLAEREPKGMRESFAAFKELVAKFPESRYAQDATDRMLYLTNALAKYEVNVARYYYNRGAYIAAINRPKRRSSATRERGERGRARRARQELRQARAHPTARRLA
jgi:TolA-binding protein